MRGIDYRCGVDSSITLILAQSFDSKRDALQGLGRVGRFGDGCKRYLLNNVPLVDTDKALLYASIQSKFVNTQGKQQTKLKPLTKFSAHMKQPTILTKDALK